MKMTYRAMQVSGLGLLYGGVSLPTTNSRPAGDKADNLHLDVGIVGSASGASRAVHSGAGTWSRLLATRVLRKLFTEPGSTE